MTRILARDNPDLIINCCCPGWVNTDMGNMVGKAPKTPGGCLPYCTCIPELVPDTELTRVTNNS